MQVALAVLDEVFASLLSHQTIYLYKAAFGRWGRKRKPLCLLLLNAVLQSQGFYQQDELYLLRYTFSLFYLQLILFLTRQLFFFFFVFRMLKAIA